MITSAKKANQIETVRRNGHSVVSKSTLRSEPDLSGQAEAFNREAAALSQLARLVAIAIEGLVATSEVLQLADVEVELGIDFYAEVERYEILLIRRALRLTKGSQMKAAALLKLKPTTLNSKIKLYEGREGKAESRNTRFSSLS